MYTFRKKKWPPRLQNNGQKLIFPRMATSYFLFFLQLPIFICLTVTVTV